MIYGRRRLINLGCEACIQKINGVFSGFRLEFCRKAEKFQSFMERCRNVPLQAATQHNSPTPLMHEVRNFLPQKDI